MSPLANTASIVIYVLLLVQLTIANVEKVIFVPPHHQPIPENFVFDDLGIHRLSPSTPIVRTYLNASFPTKDKQLGTDSWFYLDNLVPGTRYEVRVCWLATQPTDFTLTTYTITETVSDPTLLAALTNFSATNELSIPHTPRTGFHLGKHISSHRSPGTVKKREDPLRLTSYAESVLFLRIFAMADYVTMDRTLMEEVPPVLVDIILDEYLFNVLPRSLVPTIAWMAVVGFAAWWIGGWVAQSLLGVVSDASISDKVSETYTPEKQEQSGRKQQANRIKSTKAAEEKKNL